MWSEDVGHGTVLRNIDVVVLHSNDCKLIFAYKINWYVGILYMQQTYDCTVESIPVLMHS